MPKRLAAQCYGCNAGKNEQWFFTALTIIFYILYLVINFCYFYFYCLSNLYVNKNYLDKFCVI
jgi:hypothetical protein